MKQITSCLTSLFFALLAIGCGSGGGGGGSADESSDIAANVELAVSPGVIDAGDRTTVTVFIENVNDDGTVVKIRFPVGLRYILGSSEIEGDGDNFAVAPTTNVSDEKNSYLVYYFRKQLFGDSLATLSLKLLGVDKVTSGLIEVDADFNDPEVSDQDEFKIETPNFAAQGSDGIVVNN